MKNINKWIVPLAGSVLIGLSTWMLVTLVELQTIVAMLQNELMNIDKVIGRIYAHMDRLAER
jgi:hypothetical protein|tara:strand:+ start:146 stop:331 length:186 start_codon:yes stop_codon:yes gene_type:complete